MEDEEFVLHLPLSEYGRIAEQGILNILQCYLSVTVEKYCIMPNHIHMILSFSHDCGRLIVAPTGVAAQSCEKILPSDSWNTRSA